MEAKALPGAQALHASWENAANFAGEKGPVLEGCEDPQDVFIRGWIHTQIAHVLLDLTSPHLRCQ